MPRADDRPNSLRIAELFAGIGGVVGGFVDADGYETVYLNDADALAKKAFLHNFPYLEQQYHESCVSSIDGNTLLEAAGGEVDGILGCPPCQGFSAVGPRKSRDPRNDLIWHMRRLIWSVRPKFFVLENVPALLTSRYYRQFVESLSQRYVIASDVLNAAEFGVPQLRRRAVVIGFQKKLGVTPTLPTPRYGGCGKVFDYSTGDYLKLGSRPACAALGLRMEALDSTRGLVSLDDALGDLPTPSEDWLEPVSYRKDPTTVYQRRMRRSGALRVRNHTIWNHTAATAKYLSRVEPGDCPKALGARGRNERYFSQAYGRLHHRGLARTVTTNFHNPGSGRFTHYRWPRTITVREALRLQGFHDGFSFPEHISRTDAERLIGNAFPRPLARALAIHIKRLLS
jgi:DNA (cytosine-5)-methyltransferase 1